MLQAIAGRVARLVSDRRDSKALRFFAKSRRRKPLGSLPFVSMGSRTAGAALEPYPVGPTFEVFGRGGVLHFLTAGSSSTLRVRSPTQF